VSSKLFVALLAATSLSAQPAAKPSNPLIAILSEELERNFATLKAKADPAPYFISYTVIESASHSMSANAGALTVDSTARGRALDVSVRVGSPKLDNYRRIRGDWPQFSSPGMLTLDDQPAAIRRRIWLDTDRTYRAASQRYLRLKTDEQTKAAATGEAVDDFSAEEPAQYDKAPAPLTLDSKEWAARLRRLSARFLKYPGVLTSNIGINVNHEIRTLVNTEGTRIRQGSNSINVFLVARAKASDGMDLVVSESFQGREFSHLASEKEMEAAIDKAGLELTAMLKAPVVDPFVGPAILSGRASGVFFHEIFGHRIEGHRQKDDAEGQTFTKSVGKAVLPDFLSVIFDPERERVGSIDLNGHYDYDDEGVPGRKVTLVENGILKTFLLSRSPVAGFPKSNGHGRKQSGGEASSRQSNLIVESTKSVSEDKLRELLREELKKQNKPYGLYFREVTGGYTTTGRRGLQAYTVIPLVVFRVYEDGRPDELVRGADIVGTPLTSFSKILATSDKVDVFNGICGAESGSVPVSAVSPSILISEIEVQKKEQSRDRPPLLSPPMPGSIREGGR
jgi:predicted Zn-dependent protease